jgi:glycosyltransferase involved in cell wall biosynthesis
MPSHSEQAVAPCSVVIPTYNRPAPLARCLAALSKLDYGRENFEVIVVDDGSKVDLAAVADRFHERLDLKLLKQCNAGPSAARNTGIAAAKYDSIAFTDDDCAPRPDWLRTILRPLCRNPDTLVGGVCINSLPNNSYATVSQTITDVIHAHFNRNPEQAVFFPSYNMAASRRRLLEIGGFDPGFRWAEDRDLCDRWAARNWPLVVARDALIDHAHEMGLVGFLRQHFGYGRGAWRYHRARQRRQTGSFEIEGSFYTKCFRAALDSKPVTRGTLLAGLVGVWQAANAAGFGYEAMRSLIRRREATVAGA